MAQGVWLSAGGGGITSDDVTATRADVLEGKSTVTTDSNDEVVQGSIKNRGHGLTGEKAKGDSFTFGNDGVENIIDIHHIPEGCYRKDPGYSWSPAVRVPAESFLSWLNVDPGRMLNTLTVAGRQGRLPDNTRRRSGIPGISAGFSAIPVYPGAILQYAVGTDGVPRIVMCPEQGYYPGGGASYVGMPAGEFGDAADGDVLAGKTYTSISGVRRTGTAHNYAAGRTVFSSAGFDGVIISNTASGARRGLIVHSSVLNENIAPDGSYAYGNFSFANGGLNTYMRVTRGNLSSVDSFVGATFGHSINVSPFRKLKIGFKAVDLLGAYSTGGGVAVTGKCFFVGVQGSSTNGTNAVNASNSHERSFPVSTGFSKAWGANSENGRQQWVEVDISALGGQYFVGIGFAYYGVYYSDKIEGSTVINHLELIN